MAHRIDTTAIPAGAFYGLRVPAWHQLGTVVNQPAADDQVLALAGLDWTPTLRPLWTSDQEGNPVAVTERRAVVRSDTSAPIGIVGTGYTPVANQALLDTIRAIDDAKGAIIETAGAIDDGRGVWMLARHERFSFNVGKDASHGYLLLSNRHDGTATLRILPTTIRVVCANTLGMALRDRRSGHALRHSAGIMTSLADVAAQYHTAVMAHDAQVNALRALAEVRSTSDTLLALIRAAWEITPDDLKDETQRARTIRQEREAAILRIRMSETCDVEGTAGTLFSDFQAVTEYVDHHGKGAQVALGDTGDKVKANALAAALALV